MAAEVGFPSTKYEALALLYVQSQDLTGKTPSEIKEMYEKAYEEIRKVKEYHI